MKPLIEDIVDRYILEARCQHNDGWMRKAYRDRLVEIREKIDKALNEKE